MVTETTDQIAELRKFCKILATVLGLCLIAIGYLLATSGRQAKSISNGVTRSEFEAIENQVNGWKAEFDPLKERLGVAEGAVKTVGDQVSVLNDMIEKQTLVRTYANGSSIYISAGGDNPLLRINGPNGKLAMSFLVDSDGVPNFALYDTDGKRRLSMGLGVAGPHSGQYCFFAFASGQNETSQLLCDRP